MKQVTSQVMSGFGPSAQAAKRGSMAGAETSLDFDQIVAFYRPGIFRFALASLRDRDAAETVAQDCFMRAYAAQASFRGDCSLKTWLMGIAVNLIRDHIRSRRLQFWKRTRSTPLPRETISAAGLYSPDDSPEKRALLKQQIESLWSAVEYLSERQRTIFFLRFVEDLDILEIAAVTGITEGAVKTHLFRAVQALRQRMGPGQ